MAELADQVLLSRSWLTRRVMQLEAAGLVERRPSSEDGRGVSACLTRRGADVFAGAQRSHARSVRAHFADAVGAQEAAVLIEVFGRVTDRARATGRCGPPATSCGGVRSDEGCICPRCATDSSRTDTQT